MGEPVYFTTEQIDSDLSRVVCLTGHEMPADYFVGSQRDAEWLAWVMESEVMESEATELASGETPESKVRKTFKWARDHARTHGASHRG